MTEPQGVLHHFDGTADHYDESGEILLGWYWQVADDDGPACGLYGPYGSQQDAEEACVEAWLADDF